MLKATLSRDGKRRASVRVTLNAAADIADVAVARYIDDRADLYGDDPDESVSRVAARVTALIVARETRKLIVDRGEEGAWLADEHIDDTVRDAARDAVTRAGARRARVFRGQWRAGRDMLTVAVEIELIDRLGWDGHGPGRELAGDLTRTDAERALRRMLAAYGDGWWAAHETARNELDVRDVAEARVGELFADIDPGT